MKEGFNSQRFDFGDFTKEGSQSRNQRTEYARPFQSQPPSQEELEARRQQKEADQKRYKELLFSRYFSDFTEDDWNFVGCGGFRPDDEFTATLSFDERLRYDGAVKRLDKKQLERNTEFIQDFILNRYPSWWQVYDENGKQVWKMSPEHKASLARMRHFDSLSPEEKYEILKQEFPALFTARRDSPGEKFDWIIDGLIELIRALFGETENRDQPTHQPA